MCDIYLDLWSCDDDFSDICKKLLTMFDTNNVITVRVWCPHSRKWGGGLCVSGNDQAYAVLSFAHAGYVCHHRLTHMCVIVRRVMSHCWHQREHPENCFIAPEKNPLYTYSITVRPLIINAGFLIEAQNTSIKPIHNNKTTLKTFYALRNVLIWLRYWFERMMTKE